jgi:hypothetical protein
VPARRPVLVRKPSVNPLANDAMKRETRMDEICPTWMPESTDSAATHQVGSSDGQRCEVGTIHDEGECERVREDVEQTIMALHVAAHIPGESPYPFALGSQIRGGRFRRFRLRPARSPSHFAIVLE